MKRQNLFSQESVECLNYFELNGLPVINYSGFGRSICTTFRAIEWIPVDSEFSLDDKLMIVNCTENEIFNWCSIYHEYGHIANNHVLTSEGRLRRVAEGIVNESELEADRYAVEKMGKVNVVNWLKAHAERIEEQIKPILDDKMKRILPERGELLLKYLELNKKEIALRIKNVEEISI